MNIIYKIKNFIFRKVFNNKKDQFIETFNPFNKKTSKSALLYYKYSKNFIAAKEGTTLHQSLKIAEALNKNGFNVSIVDRGYKFNIKKKYDLFIGAFNTGGFKYFEFILNQLNNQTKIIGLSTGANPIIMKKKFKEREKNFLKRNKLVIDHFTRFNNNEKIKKHINKLNYLIYFGEANGFVSKSYYKYQNLKKFNIRSCISHKDKNYSLTNLTNNKLNNFIFYAGSGFLHKGLDLVIESFLKNTNLNLYICCPYKEKKFLEFYNLSKYENIHYLGNIKQNSTEEKKIFRKCSFSISVNCSGGSSASIAVARRYGLVPIVSKEEDCNTKGLILLKDNNLNTIKKIVKMASKMSINRYNKLSKINYKISFENSSKSFEQSIFKIIKKIKK